MQIGRLVGIIERQIEGTVDCTPERRMVGALLFFREIVI